MPSVNLSNLEFDVHQTRQMMESARSRHEDAVRALAKGKETLARRDARGEDEPDTESDEDAASSSTSAGTEPPPEVPLPSSAFLSKKEFAALTKLYTNPKKVLAAWKRVLAGGLRENIKELLNECRDPFLETGNIQGATPKEIRQVIKDWPAFCDKVYNHLKSNGSFISGDEHIFQDFEDTAGGCDEVVWDAGCEVIQEMVEAVREKTAPVEAAAPAAAPSAESSTRIYSQADADQVAQGH